jgi:predicted peptidase
MSHAVRGPKGEMDQTRPKPPSKTPPSSLQSTHPYTVHMTDFKTVVFAQHDGVDIALDYKLPKSAGPDHKAPILLWFHGGGESVGEQDQC